MAVVRWRVVGVASPPDELGGVYTRGLATLAAAAIELGGTELLAAERAAQELVAAEPLGEGATALLMSTAMGPTRGDLVLQAGLELLSEAEIAGVSHERLLELRDVVAEQVEAADDREHVAAVRRHNAKHWRERFTSLGL